MFFSRPFLRQLSRLVLVWYVLFVGVSVLAATLQPKTMDVVCSTMGIMKVMVQGDDAQPAQAMGMDCPLCAHSTPVLPMLSLAALAHVPDARVHIVQPLPQALLLSRTAPPLPSRGPPVLN